MALATRCPYCKTTFRVANDQLKLRAGLVRCGACKEIFNGIEHLLPPDAAARAAPASAPPAPPVQPNAMPEQETPDIASFLKQGPDTSTAPAPSQPVAEPFEDSYRSADNDPLQRMTLIDFSHAGDEPPGSDAAAEERAPEIPPAADPEHPDPLDEAIEALQRKPLRGNKKSDRADRKAEHVDEDQDGDADEPGFVKQARRRERIGGTVRLLMGIGSCLLLAALVAQSAYVFRNHLAAWFPAAKPALRQACALLHCNVDLPAQIEAVSIESSELQALTAEKNTFALTFLLRNHSAMAQAWPSIELTLNEANEQTIARRVFVPREYLGGQQELTGFGANSEQSFKVHFEVSQLKASGYRVYLFYP